MSKSSTLGILFHIRKSKKRSDGKVPVYLRLTVDGKRTEYSVKRFIDPNRWNSGAGRARGTNDESQELNNYIHVLEKKVKKAQKELLDDDKDVLGSAIVVKITGRDAKKKTLIDTFEYHNQFITQRVGIDYAKATITRYETTLSHVKKFIAEYYNAEDIQLRKIDHGFITNLEQYFKVKRGCNQNTTMKYIKNLKRVIHFAMERDWLEVDPFRKFKAKIEEVKREYLTEDELNRIESKEFKISRLDLVRDIFVFACYTGLAYVDVSQLTANNLSKGIDRNNWLIVDRIKTGTESRIFILPKAQEILNKYLHHPMVEGKPTLLPIYSNQRMNAYLKEIADLCEIDKNLTFHLSRHTFATTITLKNGVPIETVSKMLGHKSIRTTQIYAKVVDQKISDDMAILKVKLDNKGKTEIHNKKRLVQE